MKAGIQRAKAPAEVPVRGGATTRWISLVLLALTAVAYAPVRHHAFLNYDDNDYVTENPHVTAGLTRDSFVWAWTEPHSATWHPLTTLTHLLDCQLFGLDPGPPHVENAVLHALSTLVLFWVFASATAQPWCSACAAALFAVHPIHIESVAWVAERKDVLSALFWMLTLWAYVAYTRRPRAFRYVLMLAAYVAALLSKPMVVTLPFALLLLDVWPLRRFSLDAQPSTGTRRPRSEPARGRRQTRDERGMARQPGFTTPVSVASHSRPWTTLVLEKLPLLALAGLVSGVTMITQRTAGTVVSLHRSSFADRVANALVSYAAYVLKMLWPSALAPLYPFEAPLPLWQVLGAALFLGGMTVLAVWEVRRYPYLLVGWLWYVGTLVPVIGFVQYGSHAMADRYTYVPSIGMVMIVVWGIPDLLRRWEHQRVACAAAAAAAIAAYTVVTWLQLEHWQDSVSLFRHTLAVTRNNAVAELHLGAALVTLGQRDEGARHLAAGEQITRDTEARHYARVLESAPASTEAHVKLARLLADSGDDHGAEIHYREAVRLDPNLAAAHNNLAVILESSGRTEEAIAEYRAGVRLEPQRAESRSNLAAVLTDAGRPAEAIEQFQVALQLKPDLTDARFGLASAYAQAGQFRHAVTELEALLRARPEWTAVEATLAWVLATAADDGIRDGTRAVQLAEDAARRTAQRDPDVLNSLAAAYAEAGRFTDATQTAAAALELARAAGRSALVEALGQRLARYRSGEPVRSGTQGGQ